MSDDPVSVAQRCITHGVEKLHKIFPKAVKQIIEEELWKERQDKNGNYFKTFKEFVEHPLWQGLEISPTRKLKDYVQEDAEVLKLVENELSEEMQDPHSRPGNQNAAKKENTVDNVNPVSGSKGGNQADYLLSRLKRDAPDIAEGYFKGEYPSVRQAALAAGIVKQQSPFEKAVKAMKKLDNEQDLIELRHEIDLKLDEIKE
jgi:hypothetical protein